MKLTAEELDKLHRVADALHAGNGPAAASHLLDIPWTKLMGRFGDHGIHEVYTWMTSI